jgi:Domain of unknown function (DUF1906)
MSRRVFTAVTVSAAMGVAATTLAVGPRASAEPGTVANYAKQASATRYLGKAFDTCTAPSLAAMKAWVASPYRAIGVYVGGPNRACQQPNLTASWVTGASALGWKLLPIYIGLQAPCSDATKTTKITASKAAAQGTASATDAVKSLIALGLQPGSIVYDDMENYLPSDAGCHTAVLKYLSGFTKELHRRGYLSGVYAALLSGATHLNAAYQSTAYARPDVLWLARWDTKPSITTGFTVVSTNWWSVHQRVKQYQGDHYETWGGVKIDIDSDYLDAPVATVVHPYAVAAVDSAHIAPWKSAAVSGAALAKGAALKVICQTPGTLISGSNVWDKLANGTYLHDLSVNTPSATGYSTGLPRCTFPYQVTGTKGTTMRSDAGYTVTSKGVLAAGALAWMFCQKPAAKPTGTTLVWDQLDTGNFVTDYYVATPSKTTYSSPIPRC